MMLYFSPSTLLSFSGKIILHFSLILYPSLSCDFSPFFSCSSCFIFLFWLCVGSALRSLYYFFYLRKSTVHLHYCAQLLISNAVLILMVDNMTDHSENEG